MRPSGGCSRQDEARRCDWKWQSAMKQGPLHSHQSRSGLSLVRWPDKRLLGRRGEVKEDRQGASHQDERANEGACKEEEETTENGREAVRDRGERGSRDRGKKRRDLECLALFLFLCCVLKE
jgi:hypothetical protein